MSMYLRSKHSPVFVLVSALVVFAGAPLHAQQPAADAPIYSTAATLADNLKNLTGKRVTLHLKSGASLTGTVKATGAQLVHLEKLDNRDYFDALVLLEQIAAIDSRARMPGR